MAEKSANIIELNGKKYDARTGQLIHAEKKVGQPIAAPKTNKPVRIINDVQKSPTAVNRLKKEHAVAPHALNHKTQRPQTLMRRSVLKPIQHPKTPMKVQSLAKQSSNALVVTPKMSANTIHTSRAQTALRVQKSTAVSRFSTPKKFTPAAAHPVTRVAHPALAPSHQADRAGKQAFFEKALQNSTSHTNTIEATSKKPSKSSKLKKSLQRQKSVFLVAASVSILVIVGSFVAIANMSNLEIKVASLRAGVSANLPSYQPEGYVKNGPVAFSSGKVSISFKANDDSNRAYKITEEKSDWNSQTLFDSVIASSNKPHQSVQQNGNTIYLYGSSQATWVSGGVRYDVSGNANLSADQLLDIAGSI